MTIGEVMTRSLKPGRWEEVFCVRVGNKSISKTTAVCLPPTSQGVKSRRFIGQLILIKIASKDALS